MSRRRQTSARRGKRRYLPRVDKLKLEEEAMLASRKGKLTPNLKNYYTKLILGAASGLTAGLLKFEGFQGIFFGFIIILMSYWIIRYLVGITEEEMTTGKIFLKGTVSFFVIYTVVWTIIIQILHNIPYDDSINLYIKELLNF